MTTRHDIIRQLERQSMSPRELSRFFNIELKEAVDDLKHISKSVLPRKRLIREHAVCKNCGFVFKDRMKFSTPTKCPKCRDESITEVRFRVE
jgi:predicted Zn-ribbon and HTH transcriptional regulator